MPIIIQFYLLGMFGLVPSRPTDGLPFFVHELSLFLFGSLPISWHANAYVPTLAHFSCQHWPTHVQAKPCLKFWLAKYFVGQMLNRT
jgi:hypothetical protein